MSCCNKPDVATLHDFIHEIENGKYITVPCINKVCIKCFTHWYGKSDSIKRYSKKEWDYYIEEGYKL